MLSWCAGSGAVRAAHGPTLRGIVSWTDYWDGETTIYANARHKHVHYEGIARDIVSLLPGPDARVVDYGCGEALSAHLVADACARLFLCGRNVRNGNHRNDTGT